jgi:SAM dependent carboxyl methyltransferase
MPTFKSLTYIDLTQVFNDQAQNDWNSLFNRLQGSLKALALDGNNERPYNEFTNVFAVASGTSFFSQIVPHGTLSFGFSSTAMHWLSSKPSTFSRAIHVNLVTVSNDKERRLYTKQAAEDWRLILEQREKELEVGGRLVIVLLGVDEQGNYLGSTSKIPGRPKRNMLGTMDSLWKSMVSQEVTTTNSGIREHHILQLLPFSR